MARPHDLVPACQLVGCLALSTQDVVAFADALEHIVLAALTLPRARLFACQYCDRLVAPEFRYGQEETCHSCASEEYCVVF